MSMERLDQTLWVELGKNRYRYSEHQANCAVNWYSFGWSIGKIARALKVPRIVAKRILVSHMQAEVEE